MDFLSTHEWSRADIDRLLASARSYRDGEGDMHDAAIIGLAFFEESLRTRVGFETAAARLGARTTTISEAKHGSVMGRPETDLDALLSIEGWLDALCLRHPEPGFVSTVAGAAGVPVINCGNGSSEHPTQALIDLLAISDVHGGIDGLRIALVGNLDGMRSAHSLAAVLARFSDVSIRCLCPEGLELPEVLVSRLETAGQRVDVAHELDLSEIDVVYAAGLPKPSRIGHLSDEVQSRFRITRNALARFDADLPVLCPLPRVDEIAPEVDATSNASYFSQSKSALWMRMAVLDEALSRARPTAEPFQDLSTQP